MKQAIHYFIAFSLMLTSCAVEDGIDSQELSESSQTTRSFLGTEKDYYWFKGDRIPLNRDLSKCYVLFHSSDAKKVLKRLTEKGIDVKESDFKKYDFSGTDNSGDFAKTMADYSCASIDCRVEALEDIPEIQFATPYCTDEDAKFPVTNIIYAYVKNDADLPELIKESEALKLGYIGKAIDIPQLYLFGCTRGSAGDAVYCANRLYETEKFGEVQPAFISIHFDSADPLYPQQWNLNNTGQHGSSTAGYDIGYVQSTSIQNSGIIVGVVDSGVELSHPDLNINSFSWNSYTSGSSVCYSSHGTNVAGIIGAKANSIGNLGVAPGISIMSLSNHEAYINPNNRDFSTISLEFSSSIIKAADMGCAVINCCWGDFAYNSNIENAINYAITNGRGGKGCVLVFSAGNGNNNTLNYPGTHTPESDILVVGAVSYDGKRKTRQSTSNWGSNYGAGLDLVAPGVDIPTTTTGNSWITNFYGTSAAAPHVSAAAALVVAKNPLLSYEDVIYILERTANKNLPGYSFGTNKLGGTWNNEVGYGMLNLNAALNMAHSTIETPYSMQMNGNSMVSTSGSDYGYSVLSVSPSSSSYTYFWNVSSVSGDVNRYYLYPTDNGHGSSADLSIYMNSATGSGMLVVSCRAYNGNTYIGTATKYIYIN